MSRLEQLYNLREQVMKMDHFADPLEKVELTSKVSDMFYKEWKTTDERIQRSWQEVGVVHYPNDYFDADGNQI